MWGVKAEIQGGLIPIHAGECISEESTHHVLLPHTAKANFKVLFEVNKLKIVDNIPKDPLHCHPDFTHGFIKKHHLGSQMHVAERSLESCPQRVGRVPIKAHPLTC